MSVLSVESNARDQELVYLPQGPTQRPWAIHGAGGEHPSDVWPTEQFLVYPVGLHIDSSMCVYSVIILS